MATFWWFAGLALIVSSAIVILAGLAGSRGIMSIGKKTVEKATIEHETRPRSVRLDNIVLGCVGLSVGIAVIVILGT